MRTNRNFGVTVIGMLTRGRLVLEVLIVTEDSKIRCLETEGPTATGRELDQITLSSNSLPGLMVLSWVLKARFVHAGAASVSGMSVLLMIRTVFVSSPFSPSMEVNATDGGSTAMGLQTVPWISNV